MASSRRNRLCIRCQHALSGHQDDVYLPGQLHASPMYAHVNMKARTNQ